MREFVAILKLHRRPSGARWSTGGSTSPGLRLCPRRWRPALSAPVRAARIVPVLALDLATSPVDQRGRTAAGPAVLRPTAGEGVTMETTCSWKPISSSCACRPSCRTIASSPRTRPGQSQLRPLSAGLGRTGSGSAREEPPAAAHQGGSLPGAEGTGQLRLLADPQPEQAAGAGPGPRRATSSKREPILMVGNPGWAKPTSPQDWPWRPVARDTGCASTTPPAWSTT